MLVAILYFMRNKPLVGSIFFSIALGIKAAAFLMLPAMLGHIQYHHGTKVLLKAICVVVAIQVILALPFVTTETSVSDYIRRAKFTGGGRETPTEEHMKYNASYYTHSIFWTFVS